MIWRLLNWLFGWDYVIWSHIYAGTVRVRVDCTGRVYYREYPFSPPITLTDDVAKRLIWLTCKPEKYLAKPPTPAATGTEGGEADAGETRR